MTEIIRVLPEDARPRVLKGEAILVCAYDDPLKFGSMRLDGALSLQEFIARVPSLDKGREIIFYCA
ncbi:MAG: ArsR family transcriptional regulator [Deltaproteobacteria bacterium]|nr:MAG: ArsR family transcriptional regulator [Deltaproteobacteria bacterium]